MAKNLFLVDTDVLIDFSRGIEKSREKLQSLESDHILAISVITQFELMVGCKNKADFKSLHKFLTDFEVLHLSNLISQKAVDLFDKYRLSHGVLIPDMLIASTALSLDIPLISKNLKDFHFIKGLKFVEYKI